MPNLFSTESIRARPGMYVGDVHDGTGLAQMLWELVANAVDQALVGRCAHVDVTLHRAGGATVVDDGPGMDGELLARSLQAPHDDATLDGHSPHAHIGFFGGLGMAVVGALSERLEVETVRDGRVHRMAVERGVVVGALESGAAADGARGTRVRFVPDGAIFPSVHLTPEIVYPRLRELADLLAGVTFSVRDEGQSFAAPDGLADRVRRKVGAGVPVITADETLDNWRVRIAVAWTRWMGSGIEGFVNFDRTVDDGTHVHGLRRAIRALGRTEKERDGMERGLTACVAVTYPDVQFGSPRRDKLVSPEAEPKVHDVATRALREYFDAHRDELELRRRGGHE